MRSTLLGSDDRLAKAIVHIVDQEPRAAIRHAQRNTSLGNRSGVTDRLQQPDLTGADRPVLAEIDAQGEPRRCHVVGSRSASSYHTY